jgi:hypothetical protein
MLIILNQSRNSLYLTEQTRLSLLDCLLESTTNTHSDKNKSNENSPTTYLQSLFNVAFITRRNIICFYNVWIPMTLRNGRILNSCFEVHIQDCYTATLLQQVILWVECCLLSAVLSDVWSHSICRSQHMLSLPAAPLPMNKGTRAVRMTGRAEIWSAVLWRDNSCVSCLSWSLVHTYKRCPNIVPERFGANISGMK